MDTDDAVADAVFEHAHGAVAELGCQHPVRHGGRAAPLHMADGGAAHRIGGHRLQLFREFVRRGDAFCQHDDVGMLAVGAAAVDAQDDVFHVVGDLGDDDDLGAAGDARIQGDVAAAAAHYLDHADALVRGHGVAQFIDDVETGVDCRIEAEGVIGIFQVVIDGAGDTDGGDAVFLAQAFGAAERTVAADDDQAFDAAVVERFDGLLLPLYRVHFHTAGGTQHGAAALHDVGNAAHLHRHHIVVDQARIALFDPVDLHAEILCRSDDRTDTGVHAGRVAAACQHTDSFHNIPPVGSGKKFALFQVYYSKFSLQIKSVLHAYIPHRQKI